MRKKRVKTKHFTGISANRVLVREDIYCMLQTETRHEGQKTVQYFICLMTD